MTTAISESPPATVTTSNMPAPAPSRKALLSHYKQVRQFFLDLCKPLAIEDYVVQSMSDVSPTKWHLAHTSWFFEALLLNQVIPNYQSLHPQFAFLFNSYYISLGERHYRPHRGLITRPTVEQVYQYRHYVDQHVRQFLENASDAELAQWGPVVVLGLHHEQQHQELMLTDIKHVFSCNPLRPAYVERAQPQEEAVPAMQWVAFPEEIYCIGHDGNGFAYDNEGPRHRQLLPAFSIASRLVTNGEYMEFMADGGYESPLLWLSDGWATVLEQGWRAPLYWEERDGEWWMMTLAGMRPVVRSEPVCHVSYYEAQAYARWANRRLPTEAEWEVAAANHPIAGNFADNNHYHPQPLSAASANGSLNQLFGDVWEWTQSAYMPYPGYKPLEGAVGEYNGKFMSNQFVLRGGSCATSRSHVRPTYRNFFYPDSRWQFTGFRLAEEA
jgi:ergothioneine biosynthesis protein EgtB